MTIVGLINEGRHATLSISVDAFSYGLEPRNINGPEGRATSCTISPSQSAKLKLARIKLLPNILLFPLTIFFITHISNFCFICTLTITNQHVLHTCMHTELGGILLVTNQGKIPSSISSVFAGQTNF